MFDWMILLGAGYAVIASFGVTGQRLKTLAFTFTAFYFKTLYTDQLFNKTKTVRESIINSINFSLSGLD